MEVNLTPDQQAFVRHAIEAGRLHREEEAVEEALALWEERERRRIEFLASLEAAKASLARGEGYTFTSPEELRAFANDIKERGRQRLAAELAEHR